MSLQNFEPTGQGPFAIRKHHLMYLFFSLYRVIFKLFRRGCFSHSMRCRLLLLTWDFMGSKNPKTRYSQKYYFFCQSIP